MLTSSPRADTLVILDFETTGLSPDSGDRAIEIGAVRLVNGLVTEQFQELMNPGRRVSGFIEDYTGITNQMLVRVDSCEDVMGRFADFIADDNLIAHNASFDKRFLDAEFARINYSYSGEFSCSLLLSRRIFQDAHSHKLGELVRYSNIETSGDFHRALYDSEMTAKVWMKMLEDIGERYGIFDIPFELIKKLTKTPKKGVDKLLSSYSN
ncbi:DNA polymerase III subunit epsilon [Oleispira antarctica]|uniref:DNA-directed DNA polymerase n=1 Tax=Oleispira antarctica TaxID=188908 RepID=A0A1Y5HZM9_OLEAN|nr:DNA polymerase III subunit epsilon [Oleispira antarctica]